MKCLQYQSTSCMNGDVLEENMKRFGDKIKDNDYPCCYDCIMHCAIRHDKLVNEDNGLED